MDESFTAFAVVEPPGRTGGSDAGQRGHVEHPTQSAVVPFGAVQVAADATGIPWYGHQSRVGGQTSWCGEGGQVSTGDDEKFSAEAGPEAGQGFDDACVRVRKRSVIALSMPLISRSRSSSLRAVRLTRAAVPLSPGSTRDCS